MRESDGPKIRLLEVVEVRFVRGDGKIERCRDVVRYVNADTGEALAEYDPCAVVTYPPLEREVRE